MLGLRVDDPPASKPAAAVKGSVCSTRRRRSNATRRRAGTAAEVRATAPREPLEAGTIVRGYDIRHDSTRLGSDATAWLSRHDEVVGTLDNVDGRLVLGSSLHALFADDGFRPRVPRADRAPGRERDWDARMDRELDRVADAVEQNVDIATFERMIATGVAHSTEM